MGYNAILKGVAPQDRGSYFIHIGVVNTTLGSYPIHYVAQRLIIYIM